jgi:hypothetical protein
VKTLTAKKATREKTKQLFCLLSSTKSKRDDEVQLLQKNLQFAKLVHSVLLFRQGITQYRHVNFMFHIPKCEKHDDDDDGNFFFLYLQARERSR